MACVSSSIKVRRTDGRLNGFGCYIVVDNMMYDMLVHMCLALCIFYRHDKNVMLREEVGFDGYIKSSASQLWIWRRRKLTKLTASYCYVLRLRLLIYSVR